MRSVIVAFDFEVRTRPKQELRNESDGSLLDSACQLRYADDLVQFIGPERGGEKKQLKNHDHGSGCCTLLRQEPNQHLEIGRLLISVLECVSVASVICVCRSVRSSKFFKPVILADLTVRSSGALFSINTVNKSHASELLIRY